MRRLLRATWADNARRAVAPILRSVPSKACRVGKRETQSAGVARVAPGARVAKTNTALDFATRNLIAETVRESVRVAMANEAMRVDRVPVPQLHGPASYSAEAFVIGSVLAGVVSYDSLPLQRSDFWAQLTGRVWEAMGQVYDARLIPCVVEHAIQVTSTLGGAPEHYELILTEWAAIADARTALCDVAAAARLVLRHSRARRTVSLLAALADGICVGHESHQSAYEQLRDHFAAERHASAAKNG